MMIKLTLKHFGHLLMCICIPILLGESALSCTDKINQSDYYTFRGKTMYSYLEEDGQFTKFAYILKKVKLSTKSETSLSALLSTRGNYTCFAPTDKAVQNYLDSVYQTKNYDITQIPDSMANYIARNSIIDCGNEKAYLSTTFQIGALEKTNMDDRYITIDFKVLPNGYATTIVNNKSRIIKPDIEVSNGVAHVIDHVIELSTATLPALISQTDNLRIFSHLLDLTGWADSMQQYRDEYYEQHHPKGGTDMYGNVAIVPQHRYIGYTAFVETDSIFEVKWGIDAPVVVNGIVQNWDAIMAQIKERCQQVYPEATNSNLRSQENAINQFISYHLLPERIAWEKLVIHYAEMGFNYRLPNILTIDCFEYYETMGKQRRLIKLTEGAQTNGKRINRHATYDYSNFSEKSVDRPGILIKEKNGNNLFNALNGFYYTIDNILIYDDDVPNKVLNERLRFDLSSLMPELMTNGYRRLNSNQTIYIPRGYMKYFDLTEQCEYHYLTGYGTTWPDFQGDEHNVTGQYDMTMRLPPVPFEGTYEIRWAVPTYDTRGMAQLYLGKNKKNLQAIGLPLDLRLNPSNPTIGWEADTNDPDHNDANDKAMRNHGYMKPPMHDGVTTGGVVSESLRSTTAYTAYLRLRKIIWTGTIKSTDVLYIRIKSVLENTSTQYVMDWMELVPKNVYNGAEQEDKW